MDVIEFEGNSIRQLNQQIIAQDEECEKLILEMRKVEHFLSNFGFLSYGRDFVICGKHSFSLQIIFTACELTAGSVISCCETGCMADAYSLLRKYRDDIFFYLYIVVYSTCKKLKCDSQLVEKMEKNIELWINNNLKDLNTSDVLKTIGKSSLVKDAVQKYELKSYFDKIGKRLNDYIHSNGILFYNQHVNSYQGDGLRKQMQEILKNMQFITITFLFLLTLCSPLSIMSTDYVDCLDCNMTPPENSQYWAAPFVADFFKDHVNQIDENCMKYLKDNTPMEFE